MNNKSSEKQIRDAYINATPNILNSILKDCDKQEYISQQKYVDIESENIKMKKYNKNSNKVIGLALSFGAFVALMFGFNTYSTNYSVASVVSFDVNPSIEISVNSKDRILDVTALNEDAMIVISDMDLKNTDIDVAVNAIIGSMLKNGYIDASANSILISVENDDAIKGSELQTKLTNEVVQILNTDAFSGSVLSQTVSSNESLQALANTHNISLGKAQLIQQIAAQNSLYKVEDLAKLSINELNLLTDSNSVNLDNTDKIGSASSSSYIGNEKAISIAYSHANITSTQVLNSKINLDMENGAMVYEVKFSTKSDEFDYEIDATTGNVIDFEKEINDSDEQEICEDCGQLESICNDSCDIDEDAQEICDDCGQLESICNDSCDIDNDAQEICDDCGQLESICNDSCDIDDDSDESDDND